MPVSITPGNALWAFPRGHFCFTKSSCRKPFAHPSLSLHITIHRDAAHLSSPTKAPWQPCQVQSWVAGGIRGKDTVTSAQLSLRAVPAPAGGSWVPAWGLGVRPGAADGWPSGSHHAWHTQQAVGGGSAWVRG